MTPGEFYAISYRTHHFCNPLTPVTLDRALAFAELRPGDGALDLGCGNGMVSLHLAERYGLQVEAVDMEAPMIALARERIGDRGAPGAVELRVAKSDEVFSEGRQVRLVVATGAWNLVEGRPDAGRVLSRLKEAAQPGGYVLWGDLHLKKPPEGRLAVIEQTLNRGSHAQYVAAGQELGMRPLYATVSPDADFDDYTWRAFTCAERWFEEHPDPSAEKLLQHNAMLRSLYLEEGRETYGFGLYLFRA